jgi:hypothetical protein
MHIDGSGLTVEFKSPGHFEQLLTCKDTPGLAGQRKQKVEFLGAQMQLLVRQAGLARTWIDGQVSPVQEFSACLLACFTPAQYGFDPRKQLPRIEGFGEVIIRPKLKPNDLIDVFVSRGQHNDRGIVSHRTHPAAHFQAIESGQHYIQYDQGRFMALYRIERGGSIRYGQDSKTISLKVHARKLNDGRLIVHQQNQLIRHVE